MQEYEDGWKLQPPFWGELHKGVLHLQQSWEDGTSEQACARTTTENEKYKGLCLLSLLTKFSFSLSC